MVNVVLELPLRYFDEVLLHAPGLEFSLSDAVVDVLHDGWITRMASLANSVKLIQQKAPFIK